MRITLNKDFKLRHIATEYMLMSVRRGCTDTTRAFSLSESAAWLWEKAASQDEAFTEADLVDWLVGEYDIDRDTAAQDVTAMIRTWIENGIADEDTAV